MLTSAKSRVALLFLSASLLYGCGASRPVSPSDSASPFTSATAIKGLPADAYSDSKPATADYQYALKDRGLYLNVAGDVKPLDSDICPVEIIGHRGYFRSAENSASGIRRGLLAGNNSIEIDIMRLRDGNWVLHHDPVTGRASGRLQGGKVVLSRADSSLWRYVHVRDPETGALDSKEWAPFLATALDEFSRYAQPHQKLNIELKSNATESVLAGLDRFIRGKIGDRYYYSSLNLETLTAVRAINPHVYLGFIQKPHNKSVTVVRKQMGKNSPEYQKHKTMIEWGGRLGQRFYNRRNTDWTSSRNLSFIQQKLGKNAGLHLDIRRYMEVPAVLKRAHQRGMKVQTYSINGTDYHQSMLVKAAAKKRIPDGVIIDTSPYRICQRLYGGFSPAGKYRPTSALGKVIAKLPADADLEQLTDQQDYVSEGLYIRIDGEIREITRHQVSTSHSGRSSGGLPGRIRDDVLDLSTGEAIRINLKRAAQ